VSSRIPLVSVVIPCRNHAAALSRCLASVVAQELDAQFEIIVVDSAADDEVAAVVAPQRTARILRSREPLTPGPARNLGAREAAGSLIAFIDADCVAERGWLAAAVLGLSSGSKMVGGAVLDGAPWRPVAFIDNLMQFADLSPGRPAGSSRLLPSCNLAIARRDFEVIGGFPAQAMTAGEDVLFCRRAAGLWPGNMTFIPTMRVRHFGRDTFGKLWAHQEAFGHARAAMGLELRPGYRRWGRHAWMAPAVGLKRLGYLAMRTARWRPAALGVMLLLMPVLLYAVAAWCVGFRRGCREGAAT
jgi:glycosyltransferase involved in cell wall biosynthesis